MSLRQAVQAALDYEPPEPQDRAVAELALMYADAIDLADEGEIAKLGPALLASLESLQMSPRARAIARKGGSQPNGAGKGKLDELRARRARKDGTKALDATAT